MTLCISEREPGKMRNLNTVFLVIEMEAFNTKSVMFHQVSFTPFSFKRISG